ncbi:MAG TPA: hypothetical protein VKW08_08500 [Xanthobacteraceae bacterium]|jgi:maltose-binding protein MalE|nr:hypothetical protein [Xanthobacteraceae bacterium]
MLVIVALAAAMVLTRAANAPQSTDSSSDNELRTAKITVSSDSGACSQQVFDNQTGRMTKSTQGCEGAVSSNGAARRLDAISKAFSGQK